MSLCINHLSIWSMNIDESHAENDTSGQFHSISLLHAGKNEIHCGVLVCNMFFTVLME